MSVYEFAIKRPVTILVLTIVTLIFGVISLPRLAIDLYPDFNFPVAVVVTSVNGGTPSEVEKLVTKPIEQAVGTVPNLDSVSSVSVQGASQVIMMFKWGTDLDQATLDIRDKVDRVRQALPDSANSPQVLRIDPNSEPIMTFALTGEADMNKLKSIAEDQIQSRLERIEGVASVGLVGGQERVVDVVLDPAKVESYGLTLDQIRGAMQSVNQSGSAGSVREGDGKLNIRVQGEYASVQQISMTPINVGGGTIRLQDIATITDTEEEISQLSYLNGKASLGINITKSSDGNTIEVADEVNKELKEIQEELPTNLQITTVNDSSTFIKDSIYTTAEHALLGGLFGIIILFFFLGSFQSMLITIIVLPISIVATFLLMYATGQTINLISLSGLTLGLGSLVDFAVVMLENIFRKREEGKGMVEAALDGSREVGTAVFASALAQICVFLPIALVDGIASEIFGPLALTVVYSHIAALLASIVLVPMLSARILKKVPDHSGHEGKSYRGFNPVTWFNIGFTKVEKGYQSALRWALGHRKTVLASTIVLLFGSLSLIPMIGAEFMPGLDQGKITISITMPNGTVLEETEKVAVQVQEVASKVPEMTLVDTSIGSAGGGGGLSNLSTNRATVNLSLVSHVERQRSTKQVIADLQNQLSTIPGAEIKIAEQSNGMSTGSPVQVTLRGDDIDVLKDISGIIKEEMKSVKGTSNVESSLDESQQEFQVTVDAEKASMYGLTTGQILSTVNTAFHGQTATLYRTGDDEIDVRIKMPKQYQEDINYLKNLRIVTAGGAQVALSAVADIEKADAPLAINRSNQTREVSITSDLDGRDLNSVSTEIRTKLDQLSLPDGYTIEYGGQSEDMAESFISLGLAVILSIVLVYLVMAAQFESFYTPFIIMFSIPPTITGVLIGLLSTGTTLSVSVFIGYILLIGLVVNNAIVLIDYVNQLRAKGWELREAILHAGPVRLRPILMTTLTTILAIGPLAFAEGSGSESQAPMAVAVIFGLSFSTLITLILVPVVHSWFDDLGKKFRGRRKKKQKPVAPAVEAPTGL
ncbi:efflux RND transporter permease subunit [Brevibacillus dissolubilis]|uniref:efflux RND transporter permease subunit n=1 Tax=Brevibacillus dissolubilis TaxID=1844116 RepID=UPI0011171DF7|nr:efflux RND transporter permease subunit [Brevibacillus dissolubilis]